MAEPGRVNAADVERLIVVETSHPSAWVSSRPLRVEPHVEVVLFDHHAGDELDWVRPENAVRSEDGALTTTMVAILAEREVEVSAIEATAFALGIHEDTGSLGYAGTTVRDAEALAWCMRRGASQEMVAQYLHTPLAERERALLDALVAGLEPHEAGGYEVLVAGLRWPEYVEGVSNLAHKIVDLTDCRALVCLVEMDGRVFCVSGRGWPSSMPRRSRRPWEAAVIRRRHRPPTGAPSRTRVPPCSRLFRTPCAAV